MSTRRVQKVWLQLIIAHEIRFPAIIRELVTRTARLAGLAGKFQWWEISDLSRSNDSYQRFSLGDIDRLENVVTGNVAGFRFKRSKSPYAELQVKLSTRASSPQDPNLLNYDIEEEYFQEAESEAKRVDALLSTVVSLARITRPLFGSLHQSSDAARIAPELHGEHWAKEGFIPSIYWGTYFGPSLVARFGLELLLKAPVWRVNQVSDEGVLLVLSPSPLNPQSKESRQKQVALMSYLDIASYLKMVHLKAYADKQKNDNQFEESTGLRLWRKPYDVSGIPWLE